MSGTTTNHALRYPTSGDNVAPLEDCFENLADDVDVCLPRTYGADMTGGPLVLTTSEVDCPSATVTFTTTGTTAIAVAHGVFDMDQATPSGTTTNLGLLSVDGVTETKQAIFRCLTPNDRASVAQTWRVSLTAGSHTLKLRVKKTGAGGTLGCSDVHTSIVVTVHDAAS